jgi:hypothetical protein
MGNSKATELRTQAEKNILEKINEKYTFSTIASVSSTGRLPFQFRSLQLCSFFGIPCFIIQLTPSSSQFNNNSSIIVKFDTACLNLDSLCGLVVRVLGYRSGGPGSIPGTIRKKSSVSGTGSTQPRE